MSAAEQSNEETNAAYLLLVPAGLAIGLGLVLLYYSFGWEAGALNQNIGAAGFTGMDNLGPLSAVDFSLGFIVLGVVTMVLLNANAWKHTEGGY